MDREAIQVGLLELYKSEYKGDLSFGQLTEIVDKCFSDYNRIDWDIFEDARRSYITETGNVFNDNYDAVDWMKKNGDFNHHLWLLQRTGISSRKWDAMTMARHSFIEHDEKHQGNFYKEFSNILDELAKEGKE